MKFKGRRSRRKRKKRKLRPSRIMPRLERKNWQKNDVKRRKTMRRSDVNNNRIFIL